MEKLKYLVKESEKNLPEIKKLVNERVNNKDQGYFDQLEKNELKQIVRLSEIINSKNKLTEIDKAKIEHIFNKKPKKYFWRLKRYNLDYNKLSKFRDFIDKKINLRPKDLSKWVDWIIKEEIKMDEVVYESNKKDIRIEISLEDYVKNKGEIEIFLIGSKRYKNIILESLKILSGK